MKYSLTYILLASDAVHFYANLENHYPMGLYFGTLRDLVKAFETIGQLNGVVSWDMIRKS